MTAEELIRQVQEDAGEWLDEIDNIHDKQMFVVNILAHKLSESYKTIDYLKKRINYAEKIHVKN